MAANREILSERYGGVGKLFGLLPADSVSAGNACCWV